MTLYTGSSVYINEMAGEVLVETLSTTLLGAQFFMHPAGLTLVVMAEL